MWPQLMLPMGTLIDGVQCILAVMECIVLITYLSVVFYIFQLPVATEAKKRRAPKGTDH